MKRLAVEEAKRKVYRYKFLISSCGLSPETAAHIVNQPPERRRNALVLRRGLMGRNGGNVIRRRVLPDGHPAVLAVTRALR